MLNKDKLTKQKYIKRIVYKHITPAFIYMKRDDLFDFRTQSAPPKIISEPKRTFLLSNAMGTIITEKDLEDSDSDDTSSEEVISTKKDSKEIDNAKDINDKDEDTISHAFPEKMNLKDSSDSVTTMSDVESIISVDKQSNVSSLDKEVKLPKFDTCPNCDIYNKKRAVILQELLDMYDTPYKVSIEKFKEQKAMARKKAIKYTLQQILENTEEKQFKLRLMKKSIKNKINVNSKEFKVLEDTVAEKATFELNKLTSTNIRSICNNLKKLDIKTDKEAKFIGELIVFKAINEPQYTFQYAVVVADLKKSLKTENEKRMNNCTQTVFFDTVCSSVMNILSEKIEWFDTENTLKPGSYASENDQERALEELEIIRFRKKNRTLGAVDFVSHLYNLGVIKFSHIKARLNEYITIDSIEVLEVICRFVDKIGEKLYGNKHNEYVKMILKHLESKMDKYDYRIKFMIQDVLDKRKTWKQPVAVGGNRFASLIIDDDEGKPQIKEIESHKIENTKKTEDEDIGIEIEISKMIKNIYDDLEDAYDEEDIVVILDNFLIASEQFGKVKFFTLYLLNCITDTKRCSVLLPYLINNFETTKLSSNEVYKILETHKSNLDELKVDSPVSIRNYVEIICRLRICGIFNNGQFSSLKIKEYDSTITFVIPKMNDLEIPEDLKKELNINE